MRGFAAIIRLFTDFALLCFVLGASSSLCTYVVAVATSFRFFGAVGEMEEATSSTLAPAKRVLYFFVYILCVCCAVPLPGDLGSSGGARIHHTYRYMVTYHIPYIWYGMWYSMWYRMGRYSRTPKYSNAQLFGFRSCGRNNNDRATLNFYIMVYDSRPDEIEAGGLGLHAPPLLSPRHLVLSVVASFIAIWYGTVEHLPPEIDICMVTTPPTRSPDSILRLCGVSSLSCFIRLLPCESRSAIS